MTPHAARPSISKVRVLRVAQRIVRRLRLAILARTKFVAIYTRFRRFTMTARHVYVANLELVDRFSHVEGSIVECGTWKGGMIAGIATLLGNRRSYYLFDSFQGLPAAQEVDGPAAIAWQANTGAPTYYDNCTASEDDARRAMSLACVNATINKGWFRETLPKAEFPDAIAILRMDADWYESTTDILNHLFKRVRSGGVIIIDDYHTWDGCSKAVHDYLSAHSCVERIQTHKEVCFIVKT
jgi:O-methyltransferase